LVRSAQSPLTLPAGPLREDLLAIAGAGIAGASASQAVVRALSRESIRHRLLCPVSVIAVGKAAATMASAVGEQSLTIRALLAVGTHRIGPMPSVVEWFEAAHPLPDDRSVAAARRALEIAEAVPKGESLVLLLSGGASALLASPAPGLTLDDKRRTIETMMHAGADITELNTVRKHLSRIKGGRLAAACRGATLTLAVSDVIGDDVSVIGSGPGVPDKTTWTDVAAALERRGGAAHVHAVSRLVADGLGGIAPDTPKPDDPRLARAEGVVIGSRRDALDGARDAAAARGYHPIVFDAPVSGEARETARTWYASAFAAARQAGGRVCVISAGETTVRVTGDGRGGRNQEFALALARTVSGAARETIVASVGTDGIDGPTDAAGALVDRTTMIRAAQRGLRDPLSYLERNDSYAFFDTVGDLIRTGRTDTNVGDLQILLLNE
jgi:hydroxypyruvate reductase